MRENTYIDFHDLPLLLTPSQVAELLGIPVKAPHGVAGRCISEVSGTSRNTSFIPLSNTFFRNPRNWHRKPCRLCGKILTDEQRKFVHF